MSAHSLKPKHVQALLSRWREKGISVGVVKNRMACLRWWAEKINKPSIIAKSNSAYDIPERKYTDNVSKARELDNEKMAKIKDARIYCCLELQRAFGLRREECLKFQPRYADQGNRIILKGSWAKGGRAREIPIRNNHQREILNKAHQLADKGSMIPPENSYKQQLYRYEKLVSRAGFDKMHGLRHAYAQERYQELTGRESPACGGKTSSELTKQEKIQDRNARLQISQDLGHCRKEILTRYCGR